LPKIGRSRDEIHRFRILVAERKAHHRASTSPPSIPLGKREDKDYALSWARTEGKRRIFYTFLGHRQKGLKRSRYEERILGGIRWAMALE